MAKTLTFRTLADVLNAPAPTGTDYYTFLKHESVPALYARIGRPDASGVVPRLWQARFKDTARKECRPVIGAVDDFPGYVTLTLREAIAEATKLAGEASKSQVVKALTIKETCDLFLKQLETADMAEGTKDKYRNSINKYLRPLGDKLMQDLKEPFWRQFREELKRGETSLSLNPLADATIEGIFSAVAKLYRVAHEHRGIHGESLNWDPSKKIMTEAPPANKRKGHIKLEHIGKAWLASDVLVAPGWRDLFRLFLLTGLRDSLLKELKWENVDFQAGSLFFDPLARGTKRHRRAMSQDDRKELIEIPVSEYALNILRRRKLFAPAGNPYVFYAESGNKTRKTSEYLGRSDKSWALIAEAIGQHFTRHDLRRTFAGLGCTGAPNNIAHVSLLLMHSNKLIAETLNVPEITLQYAKDQVSGMRYVTETITQMVLELAGEAPKTALTARIPSLVIDESIDRQLRREEVNAIKHAPTYIEYTDVIENDE